MENYEERTLVIVKDTLKRGVPNIAPWHGGGVEAHGTGELAHQVVLKVLSAFIFFPTVDKYLVLKWKEADCC